MRVIKSQFVYGLCAATLFLATAFVGAQAPAGPQRGAAPGGQAPPAAPAAGRGAAPGSESGWATFEGQCFRCHGNTAANATTTAWAIRQMTPERIYAALTSGKHPEGQNLSDIQKQRVGEFMAGRPMGSANAGEAKRQIKSMTAGSRHQLTVQRGARIIERSATAGAGGTHNYKIALDPGATYEQMVLRQAWLGYTAPAGGQGNSTLRDAALKLFNQDPTIGAESEDSSVVVSPAGGGKKGKKKPAKPKAPKPAK